MSSAPVPRGLKERVASIQVIESTNNQRLILPGTSAVLGMQIRGRVRSETGLLATAGVTGIQQSARRYDYLGETASIIVRFTPQGATCLGVPASELAGCRAALEDLLPAAKVRELQERIGEARSTHERIASVERMLLSLPFTDDPLVTHGLKLLDAGEVHSIAALARTLGLSERQLERRFLQRVGLTPKRYVALRRFERAVELARSSPSLTDVALEAGYYDQSHFNHEFRRFTGSTPGEILRPADDVGSVQSPVRFLAQDARRGERHGDQDTRHLHERS